MSHRDQLPGAFGSRFVAQVGNPVFSDYILGVSAGHGDRGTRGELGTIAEASELFRFLAEYNR